MHQARFPNATTFPASFRFKIFANVLYDEEPLFIGDEATMFDVSVDCRGID
jgi:hypothetical protein